MTGIDLFFAVWSLFIPVTSVLLFSNVQGTTPAYLLAFLSLPYVVMFGRGKVGSVLYYLFITAGLFIVINGVSQLGLQMTFDLDLTGLRLVNDDVRQLLFRSSLFTQSLYLLTGFLTFSFVATFYKTKWDKFIFLGVSLLAVYGLYEFVFFLVTGQNGDFLSNRVFDAGSTSTRGSLFQTFTLAGTGLMRLKSLTGEPSMYAFTVLPYWIYAVHRRKTFVHLLLLLTLLLSTSTTAILGIALYFLLRLWQTKPLRKLVRGRVDAFLVYSLGFGAVLTVLAWPFVVGFVNEMIVEKLTLANTSGVDRFSSLLTSLNFFANAPLINQIFGIGFGYIRSTDFFSTLLVNTGLVGFILFTVLFAYPIVRLKNIYLHFGIKAALLVIYVTMMLAVPEFAYLSIWLFLGIAYKFLREQDAHLHQR